MTHLTRALGGAALAVATTAALVAGPAPAGAQAAPDGRIVYVAATGFGTNTTYDIHVMNEDGTGDVNLTPDPDPTDGVDPMDLDPVWSPDGTKIAFISNRVIDTNPDGNLEVFVMDADGSGVVQVTAVDPENDWEWWQSYDPDWSPDGTQLVFSGYRQWSSAELFTVPADGSGAEVHISDGTDPANKWEPQWSPDGSTILFTWGWDEWSQDLRTIDATGGNEVNLFPDTVLTSERNPDWSPDGTRIAFRSDSLSGGGNVDVWIYEYPSGVLTRVTEDPALDEDPTWSPDGSQITFTSLRGDGYDLYVIDAPPPPTTTGATRFSTASSSTASTTAGDGAVAITSAAGNEQDPSWTGAAAADTTAPRTAITRPRDGRTYARDQLRSIVGTATDDSAVARVQVALRRNSTSGAVQWWNGTSWVGGSADSPVWLRASGTDTWSLAIPRLTRSTGTTVADYTVLARSGDTSGNVESVLRAGRNQSTFEIG